MERRRAWERWDDPGIAQDIDRYWNSDSSGFEAIHRRILGQLVQQVLTSPVDRVLEVGCGSGMVYGALVPDVLVNSSYVGVDTSAQMLELARERYPTGQFISGDIFCLQFPAGTFETVLAFEVLVHIPEIQTPIAELYRVAAHSVVFTAWMSTDNQTLTAFDTIQNSQFLHRLYAYDEIMAAIQKAAHGEPYSVEVRVLSDVTWAFIIRKHQSSGATAPQLQILPFRGLTEGFRDLQRAMQSKLSAAETQLTEHEAEIERVRAALKQSEAEVEQARAALKQSKAEVEQAGAALKQSKAEVEQVRAALQTEVEQNHAALNHFEAEVAVGRSRGKAIAAELDLFRSRRIMRWLERLNNRLNLAGSVAPGFQQLLDDSLIFNKGIGGFLLQPSINLASVPFVGYPLDLERPMLSGFLLAPLFDFPANEGVLGIEIVSPANQIVTQVVIPASQIVPTSPARFDFAPIRDSNEGRFWLRVFARDTDVPLRVFEWRKYSFLGFGPLRIKAFCGFVFS